VPNLSPELWTTVSIIAGLLLTGIVGRVWSPLRKTVAAIDVVAGRPARYPGDSEERPGLAERLDRIDSTIGGMSEQINEVRAEVVSIRSEVNQVKQHVKNLEGECEG
jgi:hypothetical protein